MIFLFEEEKKKDFLSRLYSNNKRKREGKHTRERFTSWSRSKKKNAGREWLKNHFGGAHHLHAICIWLEPFPSRRAKNKKLLFSPPPYLVYSILYFLLRCCHLFFFPPAHASHLSIVEDKSWWKCPGLIKIPGSRKQTWATISALDDDGTGHAGCMLDLPSAHRSNLLK